MHIIDWLIVIFLKILAPYKFFTYLLRTTTMYIKVDISNGGCAMVCLTYHWADTNIINPFNATCSKLLLFEESSALLI